ncbi:hypothetical protein BRD18_00125 [Halobacteriales archaeon SW_7_71_33]|nr:MAG: hypothetical protein BRD18_00125 [Halobacteriales archaeon SW_7_71_33]
MNRRHLPPVNVEFEESVSGFEVRGPWDDVVEHGERFTRALQEAGADEAYPETFEEWCEWRPKLDDSGDRDINERTAEQAAVSEGEGERAGESPGDDIRTAGEHLAASYEALEDDDREGAVEGWRESLDYVVRAADSAGRKAVRSVEGAVYRHVMTQLAPYYFDNELVSANLQRAGTEGEFVFEVDVNDDDLREEAGELLREYADTVDRWHVDARPETENVEAAEGVEPPEVDDDLDPGPAS